MNKVTINNTAITSNGSGVKSSKHPVFSLKVSEKEKYTNESQWFKNYMNYVIPSEASSVEDYEMMLTSYQIANNDLTGFKDKIQQFCNPLGEDIGQINEELVPYPELYNKISALKGEMLKRGDDFKIVLLTAKAVQDKNESLFQKIKASVDEKLGLVLEKQKAEIQQMGKEEADKYIQSLRTQLEPEDLIAKNWQSEQEIFYDKALKYCYFEQDVKTKKLETFEDVIDVDKCFIFSGWKFGKPYLQVRNPLFSIYHKAPNERMIHKGDYFAYRQAVTPAEIFNNYDLTDEELAHLGMNTYTATTADKRHAIGKTAKPVYDKINQELLMSVDKTLVHDKTKGLHQSSSRTLHRQSDLIWETHFEFKAFKQVIFLSYIDEYNKEIVTVMPSNFSEFIPDTATSETFTNRFGNKSTRKIWFDEVTGTEYKAENVWIPRKYEIVRLGNKVYPICREVPNQYTNVEDPYSTFTLSTFGGVFSARNAKAVSLLQRALPPYFQYIFVKHIQNKELSKYMGSSLDMDIDQIPDDLGKDFMGNEIRDKFLTWFLYLKKTGINFYSGSQTSLGGLPPSTRSPGSKGMTFDNAMNIYNLQQLLEMIKKEIGMAMGISPQRESMFASGSNVTDNQQAITQSYNITEPYYFIHNEIWKAALNDWLINFTTYCRSIFLANPQLKEHSLHYVMPNGMDDLLKVTPEMLRHASIGLYLSNSGQNQKYIDMMFNYGQAFAQNAGEGMEAISTLTMALVSGDSPQEIHKLILMEQDKQHKRQQEMEQMKLQSQEKQVKMQVEAREDIQAHEIEKIVVKAEEDRKTNLMTSTIDAMAFDENKDENDNGVPDIIDIADHYLKAEKLSLEKDKFKHQQKVDSDQKELAQEKLVIDRKKAAKVAKTAKN
jgi:hypothetical protein